MECTNSSGQVGEKADLEQEERALEVQQANDTRDDDGCESIERQVLEDWRQEEQHKADQRRVDQAGCTCTQQAGCQCKSKWNQIKFKIKIQALPSCGKARGGEAW